MQTKKIINDGARAVDEMLEGALAAHSAHLRAVAGSPRSIIARHGPRPGKVGLVIGGGSGHEPSFLGFVGTGLADAAPIGNVFASPPPDPIVECAEAARTAFGAGETLTGCLAAAASAAPQGAEATRGMVAMKGRAARLGERALGHMDPGAASAVTVIETMARALA